MIIIIIKKLLIVYRIVRIFIGCGKHEYISIYLYNEIKEHYPLVIPLNFNLDDYNEKILNENYMKYKEYFETMYLHIDPTIRLDKEQMKAILADEDYSLIIAGAGTGKTTAMASKVKFLVDIKKVNPANIVVMSYTKKATEELERRIVIDFGIPACVTTFHSLGMMHIREIFKNRKCYVVDENIRKDIFYQYFKNEVFPYKEKIKNMLDVFKDVKFGRNSLFGKQFQNHYQDYETFDDYFEEYKKYKIKEAVDLKKLVEEKIEKRINLEQPITIKNELVKSKGEARIANFLYRNGIEYHYEKIYSELLPNRKTYRPDFTLAIGGHEVYIEYFGLSQYSDHEQSRYEKIRQMKEQYHKMHHTKFIKLDSVYGEDVLGHLKSELIQLGFELKPKRYEEIYDELLNANPIAQIYSYQNFLYSLIDTIKASVHRENYDKIVLEYVNLLSGREYKECKRQFEYIHEFYLYYQKQLYGSELYGFDFSDMIYYANLYIHQIGTNNHLNFEYLIIDEYQDISQERYEFTKNIAYRNHAKVVAVGDDFQSIFAFAGSKIQYIYNFQHYFKGAKLFYIRNTYRNSQSLINYSGRFVMKNKHQIQKQLISNKYVSNPIRFVLFDRDEEYVVLKKLLLKIHQQRPHHRIMILARTNQIIEQCYLEPELKDELGTKIQYVGYDDLIIDGMTIHKSKGLTSDEVIMIGLNQKFPKSSFSMFWLENLFKSFPEEEGIPFAEERRLFYVGLTRTKNYVYLLVNKEPKLRSPFINEIYNTIHQVDGVVDELELFSVL